MKDPRSSRASGAHSARGQGSYVPQACSVCRHKKIKCDGGKPCCETCINNGRESECSYGKEAGRRPRTEAHFQAMRKRIEVLGQYIRHLESLLDHCQREHADSAASAYQQFRPADWVESPESPDEIVNDVPEDEEEKNNSSISDELCLPTQNLKLADEGGLLLHGATAPFRYISETARPQPTVGRLFAISENPDECYILLVDGADESHFNPNFDWSRHLPPEIHLNRREHDKILGFVFKFFTSWCLRIVPPLFLRDMYRALSTSKNLPAPRQSHYSPMLHNAILAIGTAFSDDPTLRDFKARMYFLEKAKSYIEEECSTPHLCAVQALSLIGSFHSGQGEQTLGYVFFGMSARVGQALGLGVDCSSWVESGYITVEDQVDRNWVYWTTFCQDVCWSLYVGRDYCISSASKRVAIPFADVDFDKMDWVYRSSNTQPQPSYEATTFKATCELLMIAKTIMDVVNTLDTGSRQWALDQKISDIDVALHQWNSNLPEQLKNTVRMRSNPTPHLLQLHLTFHWSFILLHRPFYKRRSKTVVARENVIDHAKTCKRASDAIMELLNVWRQHFTLRYAPITLVQTVFSAGTIYLLSALQAVEGVRTAIKELRHAMKHTLLCIEYLKEVGGSWPCATKIGNILKDWLQTHVRPTISKHTVISPMSSGILPPKEPEPECSPPQAANSETSGESPSGKRKKSGSISKKRPRSSSATKGSLNLGRSSVSHQRTGSDTLPAPAPSISVAAPSSPRGKVTTTTATPSTAEVPIPANTPLLNHQALQLPSPPTAAAPSPLTLHVQSPFQLEAHSPQSLPRRSPLPAHSPSLPPVNPPPSLQQPQTSGGAPQHLQVQPTQQAFTIPVSPQPQSWTTLPVVEGGGGGGGVSSDGTQRPPVSVPGFEQPSSQARTEPPQTRPSQQQRQPDSDLFGVNGNLNIPMNGNAPPAPADLVGFATHNPQSMFQNYQHAWAPGSYPNTASYPGLAIFTNNPTATTSTTTTEAGGPGGTRPMSPISYQLAMPNGRGFWETPFVPFSAEPEEDPTAMAALNELGFEFIHRQSTATATTGAGTGAGEGAAAGMEMDSVDIEMDMEWRGREGWEDLAGDVVVGEEEFMKWFGELGEN